MLRIDVDVDARSSSQCGSSDTWKALNPYMADAVKLAICARGAKVLDIPNVLFINKVVLQGS